MNDKKRDSETAAKVAELRAEGHRLWKSGGEYQSVFLRLIIFAAILTGPYLFLQAQFPALAILFVIILWLGVVLFLGAFVIYGYGMRLRSRAERINSEILRLNPDARLITSRAEEFGRSIRAGWEQRNR